MVYVEEDMTAGQKLSCNNCDFIGGREDFEIYTRIGELHDEAICPQCRQDKTLNDGYTVMDEEFVPK